MTKLPVPFSGIHFLVLFLKTEREELFFIRLVNRPHNLAPKFETPSTSNWVVRLLFRAELIPLVKL